VTPHLSGPTPVAPAAVQIADAIVQLERGVPVRSLPVTSTGRAGIKERPEQLSEA